MPEMAEAGSASALIGLLQYGSGIIASLFYSLGFQQVHQRP
ncbi:hypothetical protein [Acinetobacter sp.]